VELSHQDGAHFKIASKVNMKKIFFSACLLAFMATGCQDDGIVKQSAGEGNLFTLEVNRGADSRTTLGENGATLWSKGDKLYVTSADGEVTGVLTLEGNGGSANGIFKGYIFGGEAKDLDHLVFPVPNMQEENMTIDMSKRNANKLDAPIVGSLEDGAVASIKNVGALIAVNVEGGAGEALELSVKDSDDNDVLGGVYTFDVATGELVYTAPSQAEAVEVTVPESGVIYVPVSVPVVAEGSEDAPEVSLTIKRGDDEEITRNVEVVEGKPSLADDIAIDENVGLASFIEVSTQEELVEALAEEGEVAIKLTQNIVVVETEDEPFAYIEVNGKVTLDLNEKSLTAQLVCENGATVSAGKDALIIVNHGAELYLDGEGNINSGDLLVAIKLTKADGEEEHPVCKLVVDGANITSKYYAISGNGNPDRENTDVTIKSGTIKSTDGTAVYLPQGSSKFTVENGNFEGKNAAIEIRDGELLIKNGTFTASASKWSYKENNNGVTGAGAALVITPHYKTDGSTTKVTIENGTFNGYYAVRAQDLQEVVENITAELIVKNGTFVGNNGLEFYDISLAKIANMAEKAVIEGGTFNKVGDTYIAEGKVAVKNEDGTYTVEDAPTTETEGTEE